MLMKIAWRNIWRNRPRSLVIIVSVGIGLWAGIFIIAFYNGMIGQRIRNAIENEISHLQIHHPDFASDNDLRYFIADGDSLVDRLRRNEKVRDVAGRVIAYGMAASTAGSSGVKICGVDASAEAKLTRLPGKLIAGDYFSTDGRNEILVGEKLANKLKLSLHQKLVLNINDRNGDISSGAYRIKGIFRTANTPYDASNVFIRRQDASLLTMMAGDLNEIAMMMRSERDLLPLADSLRAGNGRLRVETWTEINPEMQIMTVTTGQIMYYFMGIIMLALAFGIINTMLMSVLERTREIGMLLSLGMNRPRIFGMILMETLFLVMAGCPAGVIPAILTIMYTRKKGIDLSEFSDTLSSFGWETRVFPELSPGQLGMVILLVIFTALVSALFPANRALRLKPAEAIRK
jgi:ABC-type lipoprotein release transport system permease subunit